MQMEYLHTDAKKTLSERANLALVEGRQRVLRRNDAVIVLSEHEYRKLTGKQPSFKAFLLGDGPSLDGLDLTRDRTSSRRAFYC